MLTGQAKTDYQREYMRKRRSNERSNKNSDIVLKSVLPVLDPYEIGVKSPQETFKDSGESVRDRMARTPLAELEKQGGWIPNWRKVQG